jgi:DNA-binding transcriptional MerR regulator
MRVAPRGLFDGEQIRDLIFVRHAQELGFSLSEVKELLGLRQSITLVPKCNPCSRASWWMCGIRSRALPGWKLSLQGHSQLQSRAAPETGNQA